ncbi:MAG: hypothetical protein M1815_002328 [Lichina confinis]|nr:MAG: hypothetical protein M1815_002328 [Lichina confinis]
MDTDGVGEEAAGEERAHFLPASGPPPAETKVPMSAQQRHVILMCVLFLFVVEFSMYIMEPPLQAIMEDFVCHGLYPDQVAMAPRAEPDSRCKNPNVQTTLAMARSWLMWVGMFVPLLVQIPYGMVADKYGRRPVLFSGLLGLVLSTTWNVIVLRHPDAFSIWHLLPGSIALLVGGGAPSITAMVWTILTDSTSASNRTSLFYQMHAMMLLLSAAFRPVAAWLLSIDPWLPMWIGLVALVASMFSTLLIPETLRLRKLADLEHPVLAKGRRGLLQTALSAAAQELSRIWHFIRGPRSIMLLVMADGLMNPIYMAFEMNMLQYVTNRFKWDWSAATYLTTVNKVTSVIVLLVVLPLVSRTLAKRYAMEVSPRDLYLSRGSILLVTAGSLLTAVAAAPWLLVVSLVVFSFGSGFPPQLRALLAGLVEQDSLATLNTTLATAETLMGLAGVPATGWLLSKGIELGGAWMGLLFVMTSACAALAAVAMFVWKLPTGSSAKVEGGYCLVDRHEPVTADEGADASRP